MPSCTLASVKPPFVLLKGVKKCLPLSLPWTNSLFRKTRFIGMENLHTASSVSVSLFPVPARQIIPHRHPHKRIQSLEACATANFSVSHIHTNVLAYTLQPIHGQYILVLSVLWLSTIMISVAPVQAGQRRVILFLVVGNDHCTHLYKRWYDGFEWMLSVNPFAGLLRLLSSW